MTLELKPLMSASVLIGLGLTVMPAGAADEKA